MKGGGGVNRKRGIISGDGAIQEMGQYRRWGNIVGQYSGAI